MDKVLLLTQEDKVDLHNVDGGLLILASYSRRSPAQRIAKAN